jgi:hypothetical protein
VITAIKVLAGAAAAAFAVWALAYPSSGAPNRRLSPGFARVAAIIAALFVLLFAAWGYFHP